MDPNPNPLNPDTTTWAILLAVWLGFAVFFVILALATYVVMALALMRFFAKVGVEPWIAWVPIYSTWKWLELGGFPGWMSLLSLIPYGGLVTSVFLYIGMYRTGFAFRKGGEWVVLGIFLPFVWAFLLGRAEERYEPELIVQAGFPRPLVGYGSVAGPAPTAAA